MAWYDKLTDAASVAFPLWAPMAQAGRAAYNFASGNRQVSPFSGGSTSYTPPPAPARVGETTRVRDKGAFDPMGNKRVRQAMNPFEVGQFADTYRDAGRYAGSGIDAQRAADAALMQGFSGPQAYTPQNVSASTVGPNTAGVGAGIDRAAGMLSDANMSRGLQEGVYNTAMDWSQGNMPSVGQNIANEAGVRAEEQFQRAGSEANQAYGSAANNAARAYSDALAQQTFATQQAGQNAARQVGDLASDAVLRQSALTSSARGGNIGMALRAGLQGAAMQSADANRQGARLMNDANQQAAYNAAAGQRAAQAAEAAGNLAMQGTHERAGFAASAAEQAARFQAAQIGSQEQQNALNLAAGVSGDIRGADIGAANAATGLAQVGLGQDQLINNVNMANADRTFGADTFNATMGLNAADMNNRYALGYDQLNSGNFNAVADRGASAAQFGLGMQGSMSGQAAQQQQQLALQQIMADQNLSQMYFNADEAAKQRILQAYIAQQGAATDRRGQNIGLFGGGASGVGAMVGGALMSDRRAKKSVRGEKAPDFRKAGHYSYEYKNPNAEGARAGRRNGPMAQELPKTVLRKGDDGYLRVDIGELALSLASAVGDLQRKVA